MFELKYNAKIRAMQARDAAHKPGRLAPFEFQRLGMSRGWFARLKSRAFALFLRWLFSLLREVWPIVRIGRLVIVTRERDVKEVLTSPDVLEVPFGLEMTELAGGTNFVLGMEGMEHDEQNLIIRKAVRLEDAALVGGFSDKFAKALADDSKGHIDVMKDFVTRVAAETCCKYMGLAVSDADAFAEWAMAVSALLFADPFGNEETRALALNGGERLRSVVDLAIKRANARASSPDHPDTVIDRLVALKPDLTDDQIRSIVVGLVTGFVPTNTLAAGNMLQELLRRPRELNQAKNAARTNDIAKLQAILLEAARLNPALSPGQWRYARTDCVIAKGTGRDTKIPKNSVLLVATASALRDRRVFSDPGTFDPRRKIEPELLFGHGIHACLGKYLAMAQITAMFKVLFARDGLRTAGGIEYAGPFPRHLIMKFDTPSASQSMIVVSAPVRSTTPSDVIEGQIDALGNPARLEIGQTLHSTGIVHFASLSLVHAGEGKDAERRLLLELNVDGPQDRALRIIADRAHAWLRPIFLHAMEDPSAAPATADALADLLERHALKLHTWPWGSIGLNFNGTPEFSIADIENDARVAAFATKALDHYLESHSGLSGRAVAAVRYVRKFVHQDDVLRRAAQKTTDQAERLRLQDLLDEGRQLGDLLVRPSGRRLALSEFIERTKFTAFLKFMRSPTALTIVVPVLAIALMAGGFIYIALGPLELAGRVLLAVSGAIVVTAMLAGFAFGLFVWRLRAHEISDKSIDLDPNLDALTAIVERENQPSHAQNHIIAVTPLKKGWFRRLTLALALWGIKQLVTYMYRPGFVLNMGTIHYAKWFRLPGTDTLIFLANYDGSWESYLEDFITKAHPGQTAAWSNGVGFPRTRFLLLDGAQDGDRFKRWVRRQQIASRFWYSRFPKWTTDQMRNNALIRDGLARARTDTEARAWLGCFGSMQRPDYALEADEIQSLAFRGLGELNFVAYAFVKLPADQAQARDWIGEILDGGRPGIASSSGVSFGDHPFGTTPHDRARFIAFSAAGLKNLGMTEAGHDAATGLTTFPCAFNLGMANRSHVLGDADDSAPENWRWRDAPSPGLQHDGLAADAAMLIYGSSADDCAAALDDWRKPLEERGGKLLGHVLSRPIAKRGGKPGETTIDHEHFGFRDGISQPVIRGSQRSLKDIAPRDIAAPGEFILGYRNNQEFFPPSPAVGAETDLDDNLPIPSASEPSRFPAFTTRESDHEIRDFGRNGTFLVIRQLEQDVDEFRNFTEEAAASIRARYSNVGNVIGGDATADWVAAKMMGRWYDGTSLINRANLGEMTEPANLDNDFAYAVDDPRGLRCPLGAHARRANPRDSLQPGDPSQQAIVNRHRLIRRGRSYETPPSGSGAAEKGLMFVCLCADLERQFEFVQQSWIASPSFHALRDEPDPIVSTGGNGATKVFTIPTTSGALRISGMKNFVRVRAGGYFFMPSRAALRYLAKADPKVRAYQISP